MKPRDLRLLIMHVSTRCDQTCAHCSIWRSNGRAAVSLSLEARLDLIAEAKSMGARAILFTGGEPLLCDHIEALARGARGLGLSVQIATNGLGLGRSMSWLAETVEELYVSIEGPAAVHDTIRGDSMFSRLETSLSGFRGLAKRPRLIGRSVISSRNAALLDQTVAAARSLGLDGVSFLAADSTSEAFGGDPASREFLRPNETDVAAMLAAISRLDSSGDLAGFVVEDARKLTWMAADFLARAGSRAAPPCDAPEWSSVVEADGGLRPCFFQPKTGAVGPGLSLSSARRSQGYANALRNLGPKNPTCAACVCPKQISRGGFALADRVRAVLTRAVLAPSGMST